ncbi:MAG: hypothetical protein ACKVP7_22640 [Hyphomicrobiaceae bacterium]
MLVVGIIVAMIAATIAVAALVLAPQIAAGRVVYSLSPDLPKPFGYKMAWLAIRTRDSLSVVAALGLIEPENANWDTGLGTVYSSELGEARVFVSPPVNGWTLVAGLSLPQPLGKNFTDKATPLLIDLGAKFIEVQYFASCPMIDYFAWARIIDGKLVRAYAIGDEGVLWNKGKPTKEERALGLKQFEVRGPKAKRGDIGGALLMVPSEAHVMQLAQKWSLDPTRVQEAGASAALGIIGRVPHSWRSERLRKTG